MSIDETKLLFEGFLEKRKDTMKIRWMTYWFRLQNTTLFFYTKKNGSALHLRGNYYIYTVQSVREVQRVESKRFMFEIIMINGKRKMLAAETAALRQQWVGHLWQAMHLSTSRVSKSTHEVHEQRERVNSSVATCLQSDRVVELVPARPLSAPAPAGHIHHHEHSTVASPVDLPKGQQSGEATYENTQPAYSYPHHSGDSLDSPERPGWLSNAEARQEGVYDVLPPRKKLCEISTSPEMDDSVYDIPALYRRVSEPPDLTESIYDVPSSLLRTMADHTSEEDYMEDGPYWRI